VEGNSKKVNEIVVGFSTAMFTIFYSWLMMAVPSFILQLVFKMRNDTDSYMLALVPFQIGVAILGAKIAIKGVTKDISDESNKMKILICTIVIEAIAIFVIEIVIGTGMLVPLRNIIGFIVLIVTYIISNHVFLKRI